MPGCPSRLRPYLEGEGITKKSNPWKTTSLDRSIMGNQHYNGWCSHLGWAASFIKRAKLNYIFRFQYKLLKCEIVFFSFSKQILIFSCSKINVLHNALASNKLPIKPVIFERFIQSTNKHPFKRACTLDPVSTFASQRQLRKKGGRK